MKIYTLDDIEKMFQVTRRTLYNYIKSGKLHAKKVGQKWIVLEEQLKEFIDGRY